MDIRESKDKVVFENYNKNRNLYLKVQNIIKNAKIQKYVKEGNEISSEGISFIGNFNHKNELQIEKIKNVKLRIELLNSQKNEEKEEYNSEDMMADLYACAISELGGKFTIEMQDMYDRIKNEYIKQEISEEKVYNLACQKIVDSQTYLPMIHTEKTKGIFGYIKNQIQLLKIENRKLQNLIILERGKSQLGTFIYNNKNSNIIIPNNINGNAKFQ